MQELNPALIEASLQRLQVLLFGRLCTFAGFILSGRFYRDSIESRAQRKGGALNVTVILFNPQALVDVDNELCSLMLCEQFANADHSIVPLGSSKAICRDS